MVAEKPSSSRDLVIHNAAFGSNQSTKKARSTLCMFDSYLNVGLKNSLVISCCLLHTEIAFGVSTVVCTPMEFLILSSAALPFSICLL